MEKILNIISITGAFAFAISGALTAMNKKFDPFGVFIIAFATAVGGGTLRDVLVSSNAVFWLIQPSYVYFIIAGTASAIVFRKKLFYLRKTLLLFDTLGLALYTIIGVEIGLQNNLSGISCIALGTVTGAFGGVLRDILVNDIPIIFRKEIYATISILGGLLYLILHRFNIGYIYIQLIPIITIIILRLIVVYFKISFPVINTEDMKEDPGNTMKNV
jgi:uncharacterized membrane protein YeiH